MDWLLVYRSAGSTKPNQSETEVLKLLTMTIIATVNENAATVPAIKGVAAEGACASRQTAKRTTAGTRTAATLRDSPPQSLDKIQGTARSPAHSRAAIAP